MIDWTKQLDETLKEAIQTLTPGCVLKVMVGDEPVYEKAFGFRQIEPIEQPVTLDTSFDLASVTKIITTTMILKLISERKLSFNTTVGEIFVLDEPNLQRKLDEITLFQLLTHTSGLLDWYPFYTGSATFFRQLAALGDRMTVHKIGLYSDLNFILLGKIVEAGTNLPLKEAFRVLLKEPLKLSSMTYRPTYLNIAATEFGNQIEMRMCEERGLTFQGWRSTEQPICGEVNDGNTHYFFNGVSGHAGLFSNVHDVCQIGRIYTDPNYADKVGIDQEWITKVKKTSIESRSLGFERSPIFPEGFGHTGFTGTSLFVHPKKKLVAVLLTNRLHQRNPSNLNPLRKKIHETILSHT